MSDQEFKDLIDRYQTGRCSVAEKQQLESWLNDLETIDQKFDSWEEERKTSVEKKILLLVNRKIRKDSPLLGSSRHFSMLKVAASIIILLGCCFGLYKISGSWHSSQYSAISYERVKKHILSDGTIVWLKGTSHLYYPEAFAGSKREVRLVGEALFEVAKDSLHPFIVHCNSLQTVAVGTSFNIKSQPNLQQIEVVVLTGKVALSTPSNKKKVFLKPNEKARFETRTQSLHKSTAGKFESYHVGTEYDMRFEDARVDDVIKRLQKKFDVTITLKDRKGSECLVSADLTDQPLEVALKLIGQSLGGRVVNNGDHLQLDIPGCN